MTEQDENGQSHDLTFEAIFPLPFQVTRYIVHFRVIITLPEKNLTKLPDESRKLCSRRKMSQFEQEKLHFHSEANVSKTVPWSLLDKRLTGRFAPEIYEHILLLQRYLHK